MGGAFFMRVAGTGHWAGRCPDMSSHETKPPYPAEKARQGEIILRRPWQRYVFFGALAAAAILAIFFRIVAGT